MKKRFILLLAVLFLAAAAILAGCGAKDAGESPLIGNQLIEDFATKTIHGEAVTMTELFEGYDVIMLNVWGTFCGPCVQEMPHLGEIAREYADKKVLLVGVVSDISDASGVITADYLLQDALDIVETTGADYAHLLPCEGLMPLLYQVPALPTTVFLNAGGYQLGSAQVGALDKAGWTGLLDAILEQLKDEA
ncbi:MAG: TlpA family protein disulfide reductase [Oscillospiraceae bacterium]|nr:TlpA family protein disulfide reductase [Oscillospiraceae bacterium]